MTNGYTLEDMLDRIEAHVLRVEKKVETAIADVANMRAKGCAVGEAHDDDIKDLQGWRNRGILGVITTLLMSLGALLGMIFGHK
jgi:hypothetical protein